MSDSSQQLVQIQQLIVKRDFDKALVELDSLLAQDAGDVEALYMQAVCYRYCEKYDLALGSLESLKAQSPEHGRAHQEEGHTYRAMGRPDLALRAYERACHYNPALDASLRAQLEILDATDQPARRAHVQSQLDQLSALPKPLVAVVDLISQGKLLKAEDLCRKFMLKVPAHVEGMRLLADIGVRLGILEDAEFLLETATELEPENTRVRIDYIQALRKRQKYSAALTQAETLLQSQPNNLQFKSLFAIECMQSGDFPRALVAFDEILEVLPGDPVTLTSKGHALKTRGDADEAIACYRQAIAAHAGHGEAYYALANLKTYRFTEPELHAMKTLSHSNNLSFMDRVYINFALGKAYEDAKGFESAFEHYSQGNTLKKSASRYRADRMTEELQALQQVCSADFFDNHAGSGCAAPDPIFIVGLPRAGSTLLEQILSSHSQVDGTLELPNILSLSQRLRRVSIEGQAPGYPDVLGRIDPGKFTEFGEEFIRDTRIHRQGAPFFIDKMPNNFRHIGLIKLILPNAKIIDARRNPMDCCFSGYKQLFAEGQEFSYSLEDIGTYYRDYVELMAHWNRVLPGFVLQVNNEAVIDDLEGQVRRMLAFCNLPFEEACLNFHETERNVRTPSADQVRKQVSRAGVGQWQPFEEFLGPLKTALGPDLTQESIGR